MSRCRSAARGRAGHRRPVASASAAAASRSAAPASFPSARSPCGLTPPPHPPAAAQLPCGGWRAPSCPDVLMVAVREIGAVGLVTAGHRRSPVGRLRRRRVALRRAGVGGGVPAPLPR